MPRRYLLAGILACGVCGRRMESAWSNGKAAYRCRHGRTSAMTLDPARPKNTYVREDKLLPHLPPCTCFSPPPLCAHGAAPALVPMSGPPSARSRVIGYLREHEITLTWDPAAAAVQARATETAKTATVKPN